MNNTNIDRSMYSYKVVMESFGSFAMDQEPTDRMNYRSAAMEAVTGPDAGMVMEKLYKSIMSRSATNFGKIPDSEGDLTRFARYKGIVETLALLDRQTAGYNIVELKLAHDLHDALVRSRDDFVYGFRVDSQFLKVTYNSMVYALCELLNLCDVIYIDMLKAIAEGNQFVYSPNTYKDLILVQNIEKFTNMVKSGEWAQLVLKIRKDASNLLGGGEDGGDLLTFLVGAGNVSLGGVFVAAARDYQKSSKTTIGLGKAMIQMTTGAVKGMAKTVGGKVVLTIMAIAAALIIIRAIVFLFWSAAYKLRDILEDNATVVEANANSDKPIGDPETAKKVYNALYRLRDKMEASILKDDGNAKKNMKKANAEELNPTNMKSTPASNDDDDDVSLG